MKKLAFCGLLIMAAAMPVIAAPTIGDIVKVQYVNVNPAGVATVTVSDHASSGTFYAGIYNLKVNGIATPSLCIDIEDSSTTSLVDYRVEELQYAPDPLAGPMGAGKAADLVKVLSASKFWKGGLSVAQAAGLQIAVWEIVNEHDGAYDLAVGTFKATSSTAGAIAAANGYLAMLDPVTGYTGALQGFVALSNPIKDSATQFQDYVIAVPAPGALLLGTMGMGLVGWLRRRRVV